MNIKGNKKLHCACVKLGKVIKKNIILFSFGCNLHVFRHKQLVQEAAVLSRTWTDSWKNTCDQVGLQKAGINADCSALSDH